VEPELPTLAVCPEHVEEEYVGEDDLAARQTTLLRAELEATCQAQADRLDEVIRRLWWLTDEAAERRVDASIASTEANELTQHVLDKLGGTLEVLNVGGEGGAQPVQVENAVEVSNQPNEELIRQAVVDATETGNQNVWGIAGLAVGFLALLGLYKLVRP